MKNTPMQIYRKSHREHVTYEPHMSFKPWLRKLAKTEKILRSPKIDKILKTSC